MKRTTEAKSDFRFFGKTGVDTEYMDLYAFSLGCSLQLSKKKPLTHPSIPSATMNSREECALEVCKLMLFIFVSVFLKFLQLTILSNVAFKKALSLLCGMELQITRDAKWRPQVFGGGCAFTYRCATS